MITGTELLACLPVAVYMTDADGRLTFYNEAAAALWGHRPELGTTHWCGSWRLFWPDGRPLPHGECPMAIALKEGRPVRGIEAVAERPDGSRVPFLPFPTPLKDSFGRVTAGINLLVDISGVKHAEIESARLAAIVSSSDDAIVSKTLEGWITSWNAGASRIFGYTAEEMIGQHITRIIPPELWPEEDRILAKLRRGERIEHFDTVRLAKDGRRVDISLSVSPVRDGTGRIIGAAKVARDVTDRKRAEELQRLLFDELNHRVKNTLATVQAIAGQSLRRSPDPSEFVGNFNGRVQALGRAHDLLVQGKMKGADLREILREQVVLGSPEGSRIACSGPILTLEPRTAVQLALVLHELATNARKYGALSVASGFLAIEWKLLDQPERLLLLEWRESGVYDVKAPTSHGFGTTLIERTIEANGGKAVIRYEADGVSCEITLPLPADGGQVLDLRRTNGDESRSDRKARPARLAGARILVIDDEPLVAMDVESELAAAGCVVIGPAGSVEAARQLITDTDFDAALVDANLAGRPVDELAALLTRRNTPFAFATGYGREALPAAFREHPVLTKPFSPDQLLAVVRTLLRPGEGADVVPFRPKLG